MSGWISVKDELPNESEVVRTKSGDGRIFRTQLFNRQNGFEFKIVGYVWDHSNVIEWTREDGTVSGYEN